MGRRPGRSAVFLTGLLSFLLFLSIALGVITLVGAVFGFGLGGNEVSVHTLVDADRFADLPAGTVSPDEFEVAVRVVDASVVQVRWFVVRDLPFMIVGIAALWLLRGLLKSVRDGDPFTGANVDRLRILGLIVLIGIPIANLLSSLFAQQLAAVSGLPEMPIRLSLPEIALLGGLASFVLSEVFAEGLRLRGDLEGTV